MRIIDGKISYNDITPSGVVEHGREIFSVTVFDNGQRVIRTLCEFDAAKVVRDVVYTVDAALQPVEAYIRILDGDTVGSGWFRFTEDYATGDAIIPGEGHIHQKLPLQHKVRAFGSHALCSDFLRLSQVQCANIGEWQYLSECMNCSPLGRGFGEEGPKLAEQDYNYIYRGPEQVTVEAGTFDCHKFEWTIKNGSVLEMWTTEKDFLPIRMVSPMNGHIYDLVALSERQV